MLWKMGTVPISFYIEQPISMHILFFTFIRNSFKAFPSFSPPRLTYFCGLFILTSLILFSLKYKYNNHFTTERMSVFEFIARVIQHLDPITLHTRYYGIYSLLIPSPLGSRGNILRHKWRQQGLKPNVSSKGIDRKDFKISWRKLIGNHEVDPLICITCGTEMPLGATLVVKLKLIVDKESAYWELKRLRALKYYFLGRWTDHPPPFLNVA